jgi:UBX domain-containing protein 1
MLHYTCCTVLYYTSSPPKKPFDFSKSQGQSLGGVSSEQKAQTLQTFATATPARVNVDTKKATTTLALQLKNKPRSRETFNESTTVMELYQHIMSVTGLDGFELVAGFPPKPLTNPSATLKEAGLINAQVTQR